MSNSKFQELVSLRKSDYKETYEYVNKHFGCIEGCIQYLCEYLECDSRSIQIVGLLKEGGRQRDGNWRDRIEIDEDGFFNFWIQISLHEPNDSFPGFNVNNSGKSFSEKGLLPPSGLIFYLGVHQQNQNNLFTLKLLNPLQVVAEQSFVVNPEQKETFSEPFEILYREIKAALEQGLRRRLKGLKDSQAPQEQQLGFVIPVEELQSPQSK